ncbi:MAG: DUF1146 family protein [Bacilli bacterium]
MIEFNFIDSMVLVLITAICLYSLDAVEFKKFLKINRSRQAFVFYMLISLALTALVFTFYIYLKQVMFSF